MRTRRTGATSRARALHLLTGAFLLPALLALPLEAQEFDGTCTFRGSEEELAARLSPLDSAMVDLAGHTLKVCYGRPSARDREIFGGLVPFGELWRLGANEATRMHLPSAVEMGGVELEAGNYSLYVNPGAESWEFFVSESTSHWGRMIDEEVRSQEVGSFRVPVESSEEHVETFTISLHSQGPDRADLVVEWVRTRVVIPLRGSGS